jgi:hypothetical protein
VYTELGQFERAQEYSAKMLEWEALRKVAEAGEKFMDADAAITGTFSALAGNGTCDADKFLSKNFESHIKKTQTVRWKHPRSVPRQKNPLTVAWWVANKRCRERLLGLWHSC